ncbi:MAG: hypothetical protein A2848_02780 [Candidatus Magasanikbacteria bacterium RIFCSPHIGHO2_01_FULL_50_8]|uniref:HTH arsR-type domain-containing protein n=2 Tax=Candidatus Magasanikiibacteriota TaxID=1752731 RepID=A0A1F6LMC7_9BACT|nr:MAG: hypothetical protein A2848_02780 [Candidatus Magasanikbacteria bacterium RIFCSPHIGHO2_01_FULL_50_8]OGH68265.1 MAG: hypothetical protein A3C15_03950 [Candidatus Magasanikbacteria bacterium RIFCSPHIGHO2_02_FULL_50_9b]
MLEHLFGSRTRVKLLRIFFREPSKRFFVRELTRLLDVQINAVRRELLNLTRAGIISALTDESLNSFVEVSDDPHETKRKYYRLNEQSVLHPELQALLLKSHVLGEQSLVTDFLKAGDVQVLLFTGVFTNTKDAPIDILVVGDIEERTVADIISEFEREHGAQIRYTVLVPRDYLERRQLTDRFLYSVLDAPHQMAINSIKPL